MMNGDAESVAQLNLQRNPHMTLLELLAAVRKPYAQQLSQAILSVEAHIEPAFRNQEGHLAVEGGLGLPCRADYIPCNGNGMPVTVDATSRAAFESISVAYKNCSILIHPFGWDWVVVTVSGLSEAQVAEIAKAWFLRWFDPEDTNDPNDEGLYGVVHFLGEPEVVSEGIQLTLDLGSAPPEALDELLEQVSIHGATAASVA